MDKISVNENEYLVLDLLGKGKGGYSYLVLGEKQKEFFVVKQIHHESCDYYQFGDKLAAEVEAFERLDALRVPVPALLEVDWAGERLRKEYIEGETVYQLVLEERMTPALLEQARVMAAGLKEKGVNIDYFPTNFVVRRGQLWYVDYEYNPYDENWDLEHWGIQYWSKTPAFLAHVERMAKGERTDGK